MTPTKIDDGGPAFPCGERFAVIDPFSGKAVENSKAPYFGGMSLRQYAAIKLRVPDSGCEWLDAMIRESRRMDFAGQALASMTVAPDYSKGPCDAAMAERAYVIADAMLAARKEGA